MTVGKHHYALDAAALIDTCRRRLRAVMEVDDHRHPSLDDLDGALLSTERLMHCHLLALLEREEEETGETEWADRPTLVGNQDTMMETVEKLREACRKERLHRRRGSSQRKQRRAVLGGTDRVGPVGRYRWHHFPSQRFCSDVNAHFPDKMKPQLTSPLDGGNLSLRAVGIPQDFTWAWDAQRAGDSSSSGVSVPPSRGSTKSRSLDDSLIFRLIVTLQLCQVRIEDAGKVIGSRQPTIMTKILGVGLVGSVSVLLLRGNSKEPDKDHKNTLVSGKVLTAAATFAIFRRGWVHVAMNARLAHSTTALEDWQHQWVLIQSVGTSPAIDKEDSEASEEMVYQAGNDTIYSGKSSSSTRSGNLLKLIESQSNTSSVWHSHGAVRFVLIKRAMDTLYASVGAAMGWVEKQKGSPHLWMPIATAAAASYYTLTGPGLKSQEMVSSSSPDFIKQAWGVVSLPAIKHLSLQASRILKGAAVAERVTIADVPCIVLCRDRFPALATAVNRFRRQQRRETSNLSTIMEYSLHDNTDTQRRIVNIHDYPPKDVIFHLTGGGFFAHTLAGDLPYLLDWSGATNSVVICPEYALLPEKTFPAAIDQITGVYCSIISNDSAPLLGFRAERVIVTGEAAGGNLAAALCVKLCLDQFIDVEALSFRQQQSKEKAASRNGHFMDQEDVPCGSPAGEVQKEFHSQSSEIRLPDALMLCCPFLNMSLELTPSRVRGTNDPVLPSGLIKAISDGYLPHRIGVNKTDPIASPYFAPDNILCLFPPTLLCESSEDPLLDDSVDFNARLQQLGVESDLCAVHNMPHAFWGLVTAGFPEAKEVHLQCQKWLMRRLSKQ